MITPSFSLTATERVLPKLALDFTTASLDSRVTFTRTTGASNPATYVANTGYVTSATNNQPRFDYDPVALTCKGLLIEESRANLLLQSSAFDNASWTKVRLQPFGSGSVADATTSPDGTQNADKIVEDTTASNSHQLVQAVSGTTNTNPYTFTVFAKKDTRTYIDLAVFEGTTFTRNVSCLFNLTAGTAGSVTIAGGATGSVSITNYGNDWYRCTVTATLGGADTNIQLRIRLATASGFSYTGDGTSGLYVWGAQLEAGAFPTSYIPTTTTALTRNADVATMTGTNFSSWFNASEGTVYTKADCYTATPSPTRQTVVFNKVSGAAGYISLKIPRPSTATGFTVVSDASATSCDLSGQAITSNTQIPVVGAYKTDNFAFSDRGVSIATDTAGAVPTGIDRFCIGSDLLTYQNGHIQKVMYWPMRLTNAEIQAFSKS